MVGWVPVEREKHAALHLSAIQNLLTFYVHVRAVRCQVARFSIRTSRRSARRSHPISPWVPKIIQRGKQRVPSNMPIHASIHLGRLRKCFVTGPNN
jgi:hypothetical protein